MTITRTALLTLVLAAAAAAPGPDAWAGTVSANAVDMCNGALPGFEGALRKRPLAIANEGTSNAFVSCSFPSGYNSSGMYDGVVFATNRGTSTVSVTCTFVNGLVPEVTQYAPTFPLPTYFAKTVSLTAGQFAPIVVNASDYGIETFATPYMNVNCNLPPGVEMNLVGFDYNEPVTP